MSSERKIAIVTGANSGIGLATAEKLVQADYYVFLACRTQNSAIEAVQKIKQKTQRDHLEYIHLDLSNFTSIRQFVANFKAKNVPLHILINNAGLTGNGGVTSEGFETAFGTNHLGHFLLTCLLLDVLKSSAPSRVVVVASEVHKPDIAGPGPFFTFDKEEMKKANNILAYKNSKLANIWFTYELARRLGTDPEILGTVPAKIPPYSLPPSGITVCCLCPGLNTYTNLTRELPPEWVIANRAPGIERDTELQGDDVAWVATQTEVDGNGKYFRFKQLLESSEESRDRNFWRKLWQLSVEWTALPNEFLEEKLT